jgi:hypothetical protein
VLPAGKGGRELKTSHQLALLRLANGHIGAVRVINSRGNSLGQRVRARPSGAGRGVERELRPSGAGRDVERELDTKQTAVF